MAAGWDVAYRSNDAGLDCLLNCEMNEESRLAKFGGRQQGASGIQIICRTIAPVANLCPDIDRHGLSIAIISLAHNRLIRSSRWKIISFGKSPASFRKSSSWL